MILIVLVPLLGSIFWFALGREYRCAPGTVARIHRQGGSAGQRSGATA
ncbi:hypothetical protein [Microbacterium schleiferi]|uniref:Cardiolipin synthase N-terminal domain-containing protein n=1 Tax=Microbacterium schleiferi TaxID=69362 RepID=A0ABU7V760_9MICO